MHLISLAIALLAGFSGLYLGVRAYKYFGYMTRVEPPLRSLIMNSIIAGSAGFLIFFGIIMVMGFLDETYTWTTNKLLGSILISLVPGIIITIGSFVQSIMIVGYRRVLHDILRKKDNNK